VSPAKDGPRDWDKELADIDKLIASGGAAPQASPGAKPAAAPARGRGAAQPPAAGGGRLAALRHTPFFTWVRLVLALGLGIGMTQWPYTHGCGLPLYGYLAGVLTVILASFWTMVSSWKSRSGLAHFLSIILLFWGTALAAREVLPRIGYAKTSAPWQCGDQPARGAPARDPAPQAKAPPATPAGQ
jgi:hypothetical protein